MTTKDFTRTTKQTIQYYQAQSQDYAQTVQTTRTSTSDMRTTEQYAWHREHFTEESTSTSSRRSRPPQVSEQWELQTTQALAQTFQTRKVDTKVWKTEEQWQTSSSQSVQTTTQYVQKVDQYKMGRKQVYRHQYQTLAKLLDDESAFRRLADGRRFRSSSAARIAMSCPGRFQPPGRSRHLHDRAPALPSDPTRRLPQDDLHRRTQRAALCSGRELHAGSRSGDLLQRLGRDEVRLRAGHCHADQWNLRGRSADAGRGVLHLHLHASAGKQQADAGAFLPGPTFRAPRPDWITTTCGQPGSDQLPVSAVAAVRGRASVTDGNYITTTCTKPLNTAGYAASCAPSDGLTAPYIKVTCLAPAVAADDAVPSASCTDVTVGVVKTTCVKTAAGPNAVQGPVQTCVNNSSTNAPSITRPPAPIRRATNKTKFLTPALCGTPGITTPTAAPWITTDCRKPAGATTRRSLPIRVLHRRCRNGAALPEGRLHEGRDQRASRGAAAVVPDRNHVRRLSQLLRRHLRQAGLFAARPGGRVHADGSHRSALRRHDLRHERHRHAGAVLHRRRHLHGRHRQGDLRQAGGREQRRADPGRDLHVRPRRVTPNFVKVTCAGAATTAATVVTPASAWRP